MQLYFLYVQFYISNDISRAFYNWDHHPVPAMVSFVATEEELELLKDVHSVDLCNKNCCSGRKHECLIVFRVWCLMLCCCYHFRVQQLLEKKYQEQSGAGLL
jgi:hypothetical protein